MEIYGLIDNTLNQSLIYGFLALSTFISLRVLDFPDLTIEGSFPLGAAVAAVIAKTTGFSYVAIPMAVAAGCLAGVITATLYTYLGVGKLLSGILVSIGLYSINFRVMGAKANLYLLRDENLFEPLAKIDSQLAVRFFGEESSILIYPFSNILFVLLVCCVLFGLLTFFRTQRGSLIRFSRPDSRFFLESIGVDHKRHLIIGMVLANGLAGLAGALVAFRTGSASTAMGFGIILVALVSLVIGEQLIRLFHRDLTDLWPTLTAAFIGTFCYYLIIRLVRWLNTLWQTYTGYPDPTDQLQFFNSDIRILSVILFILIYLFRKEMITEINLPERL